MRPARGRARPAAIGPLLAATLLLPTTAPRARPDEPPPGRRELAYAPSPADNPLRGLVPYAGQGGDRFPHSLEFDYLPLSALVVGERRYDWGPLERLLDAIAGRGNQAVVRLYLEYPDRRDGIPAYLEAGGLKVREYLNTNTEPEPPSKVRTPDYEDPALRAMLRDFLAEFGRRYDGDPRLGFLHAGLLGTWGEWHTYPREELFASKEVQREVLDAYEAAFRETPVLLRYPAGPEDDRHAENASRPFGYHDDSFAWATLHTGREDEDWFFESLLRDAGPAALEKWKARPIGGEIRPEAWGRVFDPDPGLPEIQDFARCVEATHASWLMDSGLFGRRATRARRERALEAVGRLGYEFHVPAVALGPPREGALPVRVELVNRGVAPFYADWPIAYALLDADGRIARELRGSGSLPGLLPGDPPRTWHDRIDLRGLPPGRYRLLLRAVHPLPNGKPLRFANADQDRDRPGWLSLGAFDLAD